MTQTKELINANDQLSEYYCTEGYHTASAGLLITDGVQALAEMYKCYWLIDVIASYQHTLKQEEYQVWRWEKTSDTTGIVTCENGNKKVLRSQVIDYTDIKADTACIWVENGVALLPSEH